MQYRSCKDGHVHQVILCKRDGVYGRLRFFHPDTNEYLEVIDVTDIAEKDHALSYDWTEVVLLGNDAAQDTAKDPYNGDPEQDAQWLATYLYHRFYRISAGVKITLFKGTNKLDSNRQFLPISSRLGLFEKSETVELSSGLKIHYLYDAPYDKATGHNKSISGAIASAVSTCAIIYRNEMYDVRKGKSWTLDAPIFGVPFGARHISVHIEVPEDAAIVPDAYRQFLRYARGEQPHVSANDFAEVVRESRPQWLIELIRSFAPDSILRIGRTVVFALAKQLNKEWDQKALDIASSPESLSMAADNFSDSLQNVRRDIGRKLRTSRSISESPEESAVAYTSLRKC